MRDVTPADVVFGIPVFAEAPPWASRCPVCRVPLRDAPFAFCADATHRGNEASKKWARGILDRDDAQAEDGRAEYKEWACA